MSYPVRLAFALVWTGVVCVAAANSNSDVRLWEEDVTLPTYPAGPPDPNPMFYFGRAYQGAEGRVYPYPLYDKLSDTKTNRVYRMVYLENEFVKIGVLPEIGGRIFSAEDKSNGYPFFYRQSGIKPALIGMLGAWISGGVEWNIPHHHRASSFLPVPHRLEEHPDGSKTVWVGELELRHRMRWAVGLTLRPGRSYLEASVRVINRTPVVNSMLAWANVAVHANDRYQVIFPPRTQFGTHHSKVEFVRWPRADGRYGGSDWSAGMDIDWMKNHVFGNSVFAWNYEDDFLAGYDHGKHAGTLSIADHHVVPGKKLWTWGTGPGGQLWDKVLSDEDGPYIELMVGAYSDNQPDYSWIQPYETREWRQYWYPFRDIGGVKNATLEGAVNFEIATNGDALLGFCVTAEHTNAVVRLAAGDRSVLEKTLAIGPGRPFVAAVPLPAGVEPASLRASLSVNGKELVAYAPVRLEKIELPPPVKPPPAPKDIASQEELYLAGLRIAQFHNPALEPDPYWEEALRRDPGDARVNTAMGIQLLKKFEPARAEAHFRAALKRLTAGYTSPKDGEPYYYLGVALEAQGRHDEAFETLHKATWSFAWQAASYTVLAQIASLRQNPDEALRLVDRALAVNASNTRALGLQAALLRLKGQSQAAVAAADRAQQIDPLDVRAACERWRAGAAPVPAVLREHPATVLETAIEYGNAGLWPDAVAVLDSAPGAGVAAAYYLAYATEQAGDAAKATACYASAANASLALAFPYQGELIAVFRRALEVNPRDARAAYLLGNLLFDQQPEAAIASWEQAIALDSSNAIALRNLAMAYARQRNDLPRAIKTLETAVALGQPYPLHFFELDQLYEESGAAPEKRLAMLESHHDLVARRDDALAREVSLLVALGREEDALALMKDRRFNVWEGGARFQMHDYWTSAHLLRGHKARATGKAAEALAAYQAALVFPANLQVARFRTGGRFPEANYWIGVAETALGRTNEAREAWAQAAAELPEVGEDDILAATDRTVQAYFQALALRKLGREAEATALFERLIKSGEKALTEGRTVGVFAKFGEGQTERARVARAHYLIGLGQAGLGQAGEARASFRKALEAAPDHDGARMALGGWVQ